LLTGNNTTAGTAERVKHDTVLGAGIYYRVRYERDGFHCRVFFTLTPTLDFPYIGLLPILQRTQSLERLEQYLSEDEQ
jgi:hypothetical protein